MTGKEDMREAERGAARDRELGMDRAIDRRDFLNGAAVALGAALARPAFAAAPAPQDQPGYYPPLLTGMRGSHPGSFEAAHRLRDGAPLGQAEGPVERYDLVIVGGGISGLAAAAFYRAAKPEARVLILDNHDDFGGHAKRNEFSLQGRTELVNGGTWAIDSPRPYSVIASELLRQLGVDPVALEARCAKKRFYASLGLGRGVFFDRETFGADRLVVGVAAKPWRELLKDAPLASRVKDDIAKIYEARIDYLPGLSSDEKKARLTRMSYADYLTKTIKADPGVLPYFQKMTHGEWGVGIEAVGALEVWPFDFPGFQGLNLKPGAAPHMGFTAAGYAETARPSFISRTATPRLRGSWCVGSRRRRCRALARRTSSRRAPTIASLTARTLLRIRLMSTALKVRNVDDPTTAREVEVIYARGGRSTQRTQRPRCSPAGTA